MTTLDDVPRELAELLAAEAEKVEARLFAEGYDFADLEAARELMRDVNRHVAASVRDLIPEIRALPADAQGAAIRRASVAAVDAFLSDLTH
jgi:hypothetical protein